MKKIAAIIVSLCLSAGLCGCTDTRSSSSSSEVKIPAYLKKDNEDKQGNEEKQQQEAQKTEEEQTETEGSAKSAPEPAAAPPVSNNTAPQQAENGTVPISDDSPAVSSDGFRHGIWWANDGKGDSYYYFADNSSGCVQTQENGLGLGFSYELYGNNVVFHMDGAESSLQAMVEWTDSSSAVLHWTDGSAESLVYYSSVDINDFYFYNNSELIALALDHFEAANGWRPSYAEASIGSGGLIEVCMYDGDMFCDKYSVDRFSAEGTDLGGNSVSLD
ncbi:MAG: hypothetical protein IJK31_09830 [Ruminococcus sp.]|nr:hypothetical protein [Ruminococcus sp.]